MINTEFKEESSSFKQRILSASIWTTVAHFLSQALRLGSNLIMTRLLAPEYFGLMSISMLFIAGLHMLSDMGLRQSFIQSKRFDEVFVNTIWTMQVIRGCALWIISILLALGIYALSLHDFWPKDSVYRDKLLPYIVAIVGFGSVISGFDSTNLAKSVREFSLRKNILIGFISQITAFIVMITWALIDKSVWALVAASLVSTLVNSVLSHLMFTGVKNKFHWDKECFEQVFHFGKWIFITSILGFVLSSSDRILLGGLVDSVSLGLYSIAFFLISALKDMVCNVIHNVGFPALSETYRNKPESLKKVYYKLRLPFDLACILCCGFIFATGELIVGMLYDHRYADSGWILQILALSFFEVRYRLSTECFMAMGKPYVMIIFLIFNIVALYLLGYIAYDYFAFKGLVWAIACSTIAAIPLYLYYQRKFGVFDWKRELIVLPLLPVGYGLGLIVAYFFKQIML